MSSLILELQQEAMNPNVRVSDILRKGLVVASKLNVTEFREWIEKELNGYKSGKIPAYRHLKGEIRAWNPYNGWIPFMFENPKTAEALSHRPVAQSIAELEHLTEKDDPNAILHIPFPQSVLNQLDSEAIGLGLVPTLIISKSRLVGVIDAVRNIVLEWSLKLEKDGRNTRGWINVFNGRKTESLDDNLQYPKSNWCSWQCSDRKHPDRRLQCRSSNSEASRNTARIKE